MTDVRTFLRTDPADSRPGGVHTSDHTGRGCAWDNCDGEHVHVRLPNGLFWSPNTRASNCGRPDDRTHRCWVQHGPPDRLTVDKDGDTCPAGAGSILSYGSAAQLPDWPGIPSWHGFLRDGVLVEA